MVILFQKFIRKYINARESARSQNSDFPKALKRQINRKSIFTNSVCTYRSTRPEVFCKKGILRNFVKLTGKHLCQSLFFNKVTGLKSATLLKKWVWYRYFPVNFMKFWEHIFYRTPLMAASEPTRANFKFPMYSSHVPCVILLILLVEWKWLSLKTNTSLTSWHEKHFPAKYEILPRFWIFKLVIFWPAIVVPDVLLSNPSAMSQSCNRLSLSILVIYNLASTTMLPGLKFQIKKLSLSIQSS